MVLKLHITFLDINMCLVYKIRRTKGNRMEDLELQGRVFQRDFQVSYSLLAMCLS